MFNVEYTTNFNTEELFILQDNYYYQDYNVMLTSFRLLDSNIKNYIFTKAFREIELWLNTKCYDFSTLISKMLLNMPLTIDQNETKELTMFLSIMTDKIIKDILTRNNNQSFNHYSFVYYTDTSIAWSVKKIIY